MHGGQRIELQGGGGDDAQRALGADEKILQVIAGVVLAQAGETVPDLALRGDHLQPQAQMARIAEAHHLCAAGVGAQIATDGATALSGQTQGKQIAFAGSGLLQVLQNATGLHRDAKVGRIHGAHCIHALQAQHNLGARSIGRRACHQAGVAALRHDAQAQSRLVLRA